jgi:hypothetical protein
MNTTPRRPGDHIHQRLHIMAEDIKSTMFCTALFSAGAGAWFWPFSFSDLYQRLLGLSWKMLWLATVFVVGSWLGHRLLLPQAKPWDSSGNLGNRGVVGVLFLAVGIFTLMIAPLLWSLYNY